MNKIAFIFPGQGAQYIGMGKEFYEQNEESKKIFDLASNAVGFDLPALCFEENDRLNITEYTQIAMLTVSVATMAAIKELGISPVATGGLSLGEYGALVAADIIDFEDACKLVRKRGLYMQSEVPVGQGGMAAVLGLDASVIEAVCEDSEGIVQIANYNCPGQIVISGEKSAVEAVEAPLKEAGAKRVVMLNVSGPFHSPMLKGAGDKLGQELESVTINDIKIPYVANVTGGFVDSKEDVKDLLKRQVYSSVKWQQCFEAMVASGIDTFIEIGPGKTLSSFAKKINKEVKVYNVDKYEDLETLKVALSL